MSARATPSLSRAHFAAVAALVLAACTTVGPDYEPPTVEVPSSWTAPATPGAAQFTAEPAVIAWWRHLEDPLLDELVARAAGANLDLREALARLAESRALRGVAAGERLPSVDASLSFERRGESKNTPFGSFLPYSSVYSAGLDAAWEPDLWGRVRRAVEAADAELEVSLEDARGAALLLEAEVVRAYVDLRAFQRRAAIARSNVSLQEQTLDLVGGRFEAGLVGESDVAQARTNLASTRSRLPSFEAGLVAAENRLAVLLGRAPGALAGELASEAAIPVPPPEIAVGVPADLLRRRPDVRSAERSLAAETARIGVAESELYPELSLRGSIGVAAEDVSDLTDGDSGFFGLGPSLRWNVFDSGRLRLQVVAQEARAEQALARWEKAVLVALEEAENAMSAYVHEQDRRNALLEAASQARRAVDLARIQYTEGLSDFQTVLVSERSLAELEDELATSEAAIAASFVALHEALGGGWEENELLPRNALGH
jgi:NodT family efflux transporter outer membrane factor (OMF) lipoprotein